MSSKKRFNTMRNSERINFPTIIVAVKEIEMRRGLIESLGWDNCLVLEADSPESALDFVKMHSRPIHVAVIDAEMGEDFARMLQPYRRNLKIVRLSGAENGPCSVTGILEEVRALLPARQISRPDSHQL